MSRTLAGTSKTSFALVATAPAGPKCPYAPNCGFAFFGIQDDIAIDAAGNLYLVWQDGQDHTKAGSPPIVQLSRCDAGIDCTDGPSWAYVGRVDDKNAIGLRPTPVLRPVPPRGGRRRRPDRGDVDGRPDRDAARSHQRVERLAADVDHGRDSLDGTERAGVQYDPGQPESNRTGSCSRTATTRGSTSGPDRAVMIWGEGNNYTGGPANPGHVIYRSMAI